MSNTRERAPLVQGGAYRLGSGNDEADQDRITAVYTHRNDQPNNIDISRVFGIILFLTATAPILLASMFASVDPLQIGLLSNDWTSYVDTQHTYLPGRYMVGWGKSFVLFPSTQINMIFSDNHAKGIRPDALPISTRTGDDHGELDSGGQPITISMSLQYKLPQDSHLGGIYSSFGLGYHQRYLLLTRNTVSNIAQQFSPVDFWQRREDVSDAMFAAVKTALKAQGGVEVRVSWRVEM
jgi:hypothetical protein